MADVLRIAYCEDENVQLLLMKQLIEEWQEQSGVLCTYSPYESGKAFLFENGENYPFDLLLLDIDMEGLDGMELARKVRESDSKIPIVFLTNRREYVFEGYEVNAFRYLLKPMDFPKLFLLLNEISKQHLAKKFYIIEKQDGETVKIDLDDIYYIEASGHYVNVYLQGKEYRFKKSLQELADVIQINRESLIQAGFVYTHRSYLVHLKYVERVQKAECIMENKRMVPISRSAYKGVNEAFIKYYHKKQMI